MSRTNLQQMSKFRLREVLLVMTVVALGIGLFIISRRMQLAESSLKTLREEVGETLGQLNVDDPTLVHVRALQSDEPNTWQWRMHIPKGHKYAWKAAYANIPMDGVPANGATAGISNEPYWEADCNVLVTARLKQDESGEWRLSVESFIANSINQMSGVTVRIPDDDMKWMRESSSTNGRHLGSSGQNAIDPKGPIVLLQRRDNKHMPDGSRQPAPEPGPGFMIWLEEHL